MTKPRFSAKEIAAQKANALDDIAMLEGAPPHNTWSNICYGDGIFAQSICNRYGGSINQIKKWCGYKAKPGKMPDWD